MNYELFLAKRIITGKEHKSSISSSIIKIAIIAIAVGLIIMLVSVATTIGLQKKIKEKISGFNGHIQISNYEDNNSLITISPLSIQQDFYPEFKNISGIQNLQSYATKGGIIRTEKDFEGVIYKGVSTDYNWSFFKDYLVEGKLVTINDEFNNTTLISEITANRLGLKVGDKFNMFFMKDDASPPNLRVFTVAGIYSTGYNDFDQNYVIGDIKHVQRLNKWDKTQVGGFEVLLDDFGQLEEKGDEIYNSIGATLNAQAISEKYRDIFDWLKLLDTNIVVILVIMIVIAGINMITALLVLILERTQMVGILKALGSTNWSIRKVFLYNAAYLIAIGLFWGNLIGMGLLMAQERFGFVKLDPENYYVSEAPVFYNLPILLYLNIGTLILCLLMLLIPSIIISKISPIKAIKFD